MTSRTTAKLVDMSYSSPPRLITESYEPILLLSPQDEQDLAKQGIDALQLHVEMLPSINRKYHPSGGKTLFTGKEYKLREERVRASILAQVQAANWKVSELDRYLVVFDFALKGGDIDGPLKATQDALQQAKPSVTEFKKMADPEKLATWKAAHPPILDPHGKRKQPLPKKNQWPGLADRTQLEAWKAVHPPAIRNDGQILLEIVVKHIKQPKGTEGLITIYRNIPYPLFLHQLLLARFTGRISEEHFLRKDSSAHDH